MINTCNNSDTHLTKLMSVNTITPDSVFPKLFSEEDIGADGGKNHPSILAKSRRPSRWNNIDAPSRILFMTSRGKRGGV